MMSGKIGVNGRIVESHQAAISVYDHGFLYGIGVFETLRLYGGRLFLFDEHMERLEQGLRRLGIHWRVTRAAVWDHILQLSAANGWPDAYVRLSVSAGEAPLGLPEAPYEHPVWIVHMKPLPPLQAENPETPGKRLQVLKTPRTRPETDPRMKSFHFMNNILGKRELQSYPWARGAEGLFLTADGFVAEGLVSNIFFVKNGQILTPSLAAGILPGVIRGWIFRAAGSGLVSHHIKEGLFTLEEGLAAEEWFLTNSILGIVPVTHIYSPGGELLWEAQAQAAGEVTRALQKQYRLAIGR